MSITADSILQMLKVDGPSAITGIPRAAQFLLDVIEEKYSVELLKEVASKAPQLHAFHWECQMLVALFENRPIDVLRMAGDREFKAEDMVIISNFLYTASYILQAEYEKNAKTPQPSFRAREPTVILLEKRQDAINWSWFTPEGFVEK